MGLSNLVLRPLSAAAQGSAYLLTHRSWTSRIGTGLRKWSFSRPRRRVTTRPASSSCLRCFITPKRDISKRSSSALNVCPSSRKSSSSRLRRVGSARALNTASTPTNIGDYLVTCQSPADQASACRLNPPDACEHPRGAGWDAPERAGRTSHRADRGGTAQLARHLPAGDEVATTAVFG